MYQRDRWSRISRVCYASLDKLIKDLGDAVKAKAATARPDLSPGAAREAATDDPVPVVMSPSGGPKKVTTDAVGYVADAAS